MKNLFRLCCILFSGFIFSQNENPNIILLIGDGMGLSQISAGLYANGNKTALEDFTTVGLSKTYSSDNLVTDSAASGTAMATGVKTYNGAIGLDPNKNPHISILEICAEKGYKTALLATSSIVHATPASFYAKVPSRKNYEDIALALSKHSVNLFFGGGKKHFEKREDGRDLIDEMDSYDFVKNLRQLEKSTSDKIGYFTYDDEPPRKLDDRTPALDEAVEIALEKLKAHDQPFFMMVEGSQIDWGGHANETDYILSEFKEFDTTLQKVLEFAKKEGNTLVVVTADHETGGFALTQGSIETGAMIGKFNTKGHTATLVPVFSYGPYAALFSGIYENTAIFEKMKSIVK